LQEELVFVQYWCSDYVQSTLMGGELV